MTIQNATALPSTMTLSVPAVDQLSSQLVTLQGEQSSGILADSYAGLGDQRYQALNLQPEITKVAAWQGNITAAQTTLGVTQTAMSSISGIATSLQTSLLSLQSDKSATNLSTVTTQARSALTELASLLNTTSGSQYVFAGNASETAPITDPANITDSGFFQTIANSVASVGTTGAAAVETASVDAAADTTSGQSAFSATLSVSATAAKSLSHTVTVGDQQQVAVGVVATQGGAATATSTGSPIRDLMRALAVVASLGQADSSSAAFSTLVDDTSTQMTAVSSGLNLMVASVGQTQTQLTSQTSSLSDLSNSLTEQLGVTKDADYLTLSTQITGTQAQLQASYSIIADMKNLSLTNYI